VNLDEEEGRQTAELLPVINAQAGRDRQLKPQVLYVRLRALAEDGYLCHQDVSRTPVTKVYRLLPPGRTLIEDLASFGFLLRTRGSRARVLRSSHGGAGVTPPARTRPGSGQDDG
jgi:DNA-binding PadR family transcriptional regulator